MSEISDKNIAQFILIGNGSDYGESIILNVGNNNWIVVDSCIDPYTKKCIPLQYLIEAGVNIKQDVKLIVCTHWHDDHIQGISQLYQECESSKFCMAIAKDKRKFLQLVMLDYEKAKSSESISSTNELNKCLKIKKERELPFIYAVQDKPLFFHEENNITSQVISLSPSDQTIEDYDAQISTLMKEYAASNRKIVNLSPNDKSVVLLVKINEHRILLGSDLEVNSDENKGWLGILNNSLSIDSTKASIFKIPHHGSETAYHERIWEEMVNTNAISGLTPWNKGNKLPKIKMLNTFFNHTNNLFITSLKNHVKPKNRERRIAKAISRSNNTLREIKPSTGVIRCTFNLKEKSSGWNVQLLKSAFRIDNKFLMKNK